MWRRLFLPGLILGLRYPLWLLTSLRWESARQRAGVRFLLLGWSQLRFWVRFMFCTVQALARVLNASIARNLPAVPRNYFALGTSPILWRKLKGALQAFADESAGQEKLIASANATFLRVGQAVTRHCEDRTDTPTADAKL